MTTKDELANTLRMESKSGKDNIARAMVLRMAAERIEELKNENSR